MDWKHMKTEKLKIPTTIKPKLKERALETKLIIFFLSQPPMKNNICI